MRAVLEKLDGGVMLIRLGDPSEKVVTFTPERLQSLKDIIYTLKSKPPAGVVITGPTLDMFTVGADISLIQEVTDPKIGESLAKEGQAVFTEIEKLPFRTVAAISGPCVGGGFELALACNFRLISDSSSSTVGLPEVKLGIIPGFGGTVRLPKLVGLPKALDLILTGKTVRAKKALALGLVDEVTPAHALIERARCVAAGSLRLRRKSIGIKDTILSSILKGIVKKSAKASVLKQTKGFYPAPLKALESVFASNYDVEAKLLGEAIVTPESKALTHVFFLTELSKGIGKGAKKHLENFSASVIGAGVMGAGIASILAASEIPVVLKDTSEDAISKARIQIRGFADSLSYLSPSERNILVSRVTATTEDPPVGVGIVIEAIVENMAVKKKVLSELALKLGEQTIIASNTSSLSISEMAKDIPNPSRVIGMHFFNPVPKMPLVEIIMGSKTSDQTIALVAGLSVKLGKFPIVVKDVPGFLVNRILTPYLNEAAFLIQEGYKIDDIDKAATSFGLPMGPVRLLDEIGLDVASHVSEIMVKGYGSRMEAPPLASKLVATGALGKKNDLGFYDFSTKKPRRDLYSVLALPKEKDGSSDIQDRLIFSLLNEAVLCLDEGVAGTPGTEAAKQIDLGSVMGFGFPPFKGGILYWAHKTGVASLIDRSKELEKKYGVRFKPNEGLLKRAQKGFY